eukprot:6124392-Amphidinium_carterae.1
MSAGLCSLGRWAPGSRKRRRPLMEGIADGFIKVLRAEFGDLNRCCLEVTVAVTWEIWRWIPLQCGGDRKGQEVLVQLPRLAWSEREGGESSLSTWKRWHRASGPTGRQATRTGGGLIGRSHTAPQGARKRKWKKLDETDFEKAVPNYASNSGKEDIMEGQLQSEAEEGLMFKRMPQQVQNRFGEMIYGSRHWVLSTSWTTRSG